MLRCCGHTKDRKICNNRISPGSILCYQHICQNTDIEPRVEKSRCSGITQKGVRCKRLPPSSVKSGCTV